MCLILFAYRQHADYPLIVIANRDEYYARPTQDAHWWPGTEVFAGRDLEAGGTWLGVTSRGRLAAVTNVREPGAGRVAKKSRGELTRRFLTDGLDAEDYLTQLAPHADQYSGFNLLLGDRRGLWFFSNRTAGIHCIEPGIYGISNGSFDEPWPKLVSAKIELERRLGHPFTAGDLIEILTDHQVAADHELPATGVTIDIERMLSSRFIRSPDYGTRASSLVMIDARQRLSFHEYNYLDANRSGARISETFAIQED